MNVLSSERPLLWSPFVFGLQVMGDANVVTVHGTGMKWHRNVMAQERRTVPRTMIVAVHCRPVHSHEH